MAVIPLYFSTNGDLIKDPRECAMIVIGSTVYLPAFSLSDAQLHDATPRANPGSLMAIIQSLPFDGEVTLSPVRDHVQKALHEVARRMNVRVSTRSSIVNGKRALKVWRKRA